VVVSFFGFAIAIINFIFLMLFIKKNYLWWQNTKGMIVFILFGVGAVFYLLFFIISMLLMIKPALVNTLDQWHDKLYPIKYEQIHGWESIRIVSRIKYAIGVMIFCIACCCSSLLIILC
ncbi:MAG: hypothetical protein IKC56_04995, partial [Clostridia bacterium]|nr:hypothetical protein [Clostridia bacterium]